MAAENNLGKQWKKVYRGISSHPDKVNLTAAGTHWTPHLNVAKDFAETFGEGTVIEGNVHSKEVVKPHSVEWYRMGGVRPGSEEEYKVESGMAYQDNSSIFDPEHSHEQEVTIRPKGLVHISKLHHFKDGITTSQDINATGQA